VPFEAGKAGVLRQPERDLDLEPYFHLPTIYLATLVRVSLRHVDIALPLY